MKPSLAEALRSIVGPRWVRDRKAELATYMMDGLPTHESVPGIVVMPGSRAEVVEVLRLLHLLNLPFVARGAVRVFRAVRWPSPTPCSSP